MSFLSLPLRKKREYIWAFLFVSPVLLYALVFIFIPMVIAFVSSFTRWDMISPPKWVGLKNYIGLFTDRVTYPYFWKSLWVTVKYVLLVVPCSLVLSLFLAFMLSEKIKGRSIFRTLYFLPVITSAVAVGVVWKAIYDPQVGILNKILSVIFHKNITINWIYNPKLAIISIALVTVWQGLGYYTVIYSAALTNIPKSLYEAAEIDGANKWQQFWYVTFPMLYPTTFFLLVTSVISTFQVFDMIYIFTNGYPTPETMVFTLQIYKYAFVYNNMGVACALSYILFLIMIVITWLQFKFVPQHYE